MTPPDLDSESGLKDSPALNTSYKRIRNRHEGRYPIALGLLYFVLQLLAYPFAIFGTLVQRSEIVRLFVRKTS